jgi:hypothetical protein
MYSPHYPVLTLKLFDAVSETQDATKPVSADRMSDTRARSCASSHEVEEEDENATIDVTILCSGGSSSVRVL